MRDLSMFFRWAEFKDYVGGNPFDKVLRPTVKRVAPEIFSVEEARRLLFTALNNPELGLLPMYAIALFSGVRVEELQLLTWEMIDLDEGEIRLPAEVTKTGLPRNIEIFDAVEETLRSFGRQTGKIVSPKNLRIRRAKLFELADVPRKRNALRHSFASYHAAKYRNPGDLQMLLGQETPSIMFKHYIAATPKRRGEAFFNLRPPFELPTLGSEVVPLLERHKAVQKSATAPPGQRPDPIDHYNSTSIATGLRLIMASRITLADDFVTRGSHFLGMYPLVQAAYTDREIKCFALMRTNSFGGEVTKHVLPVSGTIRNNNGTPWRP